MKLERIQVFKAELAGRPTSDWGEILFRLANEAAATTNAEAKTEATFHYLRKEIELLKMKLSLAMPTLEFYSKHETYTSNLPTEDLPVQARAAIDKIRKVDWLAGGGDPLEFPQSS